MLENPELTLKSSKDAGGHSAETDQTAGAGRRTEAAIP